jgi:hypothetical protein
MYVIIANNRTRLVALMQQKLSKRSSPKKRDCLVFAICIPERNRYLVPGSSKTWVLSTKIPGTIGTRYISLINHVDLVGASAQSGVGGNLAGQRPGGRAAYCVLDGLGGVELPRGGKVET